MNTKTDRTRRRVDWQKGTTVSEEPTVKIGKKSTLKMEAAGSLKTLVYTRLHGVTPQDAVIFEISTVSSLLNVTT
jgi:hypothetical protein